MSTRSLLWFTKNLRLQDNALIEWAIKNRSLASGVCFVPPFESELQRQFFILSALEIKRQFEELKIPFEILKSDPERTLPALVSANNIDVVLVQQVYNSRDQKLLSKVQSQLGNKLKTFDDATLIRICDLPMEISEFPTVFTSFRKQVEKNLRILSPYDYELKDLIPMPDFQKSTKDIKHEDQEKTIFPVGAIPGESAALNRLADYLWGSRAIQTYKETRNGMMELNDSSKLSIPLAYGCISARTIYHELVDFESEFERNESSLWFFYELLWRDYFKFLSLKIGEALFRLNGTNQRPRAWSQDRSEFENWKNAQTPSDFVNANMIEISLTGWMSNRGRQNVASYLAKTMDIDWTLGASYFEANLLDDDTESNWGNWQYVAGVGTDPRDRVFDVHRQAKMYDPDGRYQKFWLGQKKLQTQ